MKCDSYSIKDIALSWDVDNDTIKRRVLNGDLKASIAQLDGSFKTCGKFDDIPSNIRENLKIMSYDLVDNLSIAAISNAWDSLCFTYDEIKRCERSLLPVTSKTSPTEALNNDNPKAIGTLLKMIAVMASKGYKYDPKDKKSHVPSEIVDDAAELGIAIDVKTVREWLRKAAENNIEQNNLEDI